MSGPGPAGRGRALRQAFLLGYLGLQLALPLRGLRVDKLDTRGDLSWNMFAHDYECSIDYSVREADGSTRRLDFDALFRNRVSSTKVLHRDVLPELHAWICRTLLDDADELHGLVSCRLDGGSWTDLVDPRQDLCAIARAGAPPG